MISVHRALRVAHAAATRSAPTEVTYYRITYPSADNPRATAFQGSVSTSYHRGTFAPLTTEHEPVESNRSVSGVLTLSRVSLGFLPSQADRVSIGGTVFNVAEVHDVEGAVVRLILRGPAPTPVETELPALILRGRFPMVDMRDAAFIGQNDIYGRIDTSTVTLNESDFDEIAKNAVVFTDFDRMATETGQWVCGRLREKNPDIIFLAYEHFGHLPPGAEYPTIPFRNWKFLNLPRAQTVDGTDAVAWYAGGDSNNDPSDYWIDYMSNPTPGLTYNQQLIDDYVGEWKRIYDSLEHRPVGIKFDYFSTVAQGYYVWPGDPAIDLNQNGVAYGDDAAEQASFKAFQEAMVRTTRRVFGENVLLHANGQAGIPEFAEDDLLAEGLNGYFTEGFPTTVFGQDPVDVMVDAYAATVAKTTSYVPMSNGNVFFTTDLKPVYAFDGTRAEFGRSAALLFDGVWRYRPYDSLGNLVRSEFYDEGFVATVDALGEPTGSATQTIVGSSVVYQRFFAGGSVTVSLNTAASGTIQIAANLVVLS